jgi:prepilin-type N-terminal cleavage/methylation domain-containing protein
MKGQSVRGESSSGNRDKPTRSAFTLIELLVVLGIIVVLTGLLLPALAVARGHAQSIVCTNNLHELFVGMMAFTAANNDALPGNCNDRNNPIATQRDWLTGGGEQYTDAPQLGTLYLYVGNNSAIYRCPSLDAQPHLPNRSNGRFDYSFFSSFDGAKLAKIKTNSSYLYLDGHTDTVATPVLVEEDPWYSINNLLQTGNSAGTHYGGDRLSHTHFGQAHYAAIDGSVDTFKEPIIPVTANPDAADRWESAAPSGKLVGLGYGYGSYGWWNAQ